MPLGFTTGDRVRITVFGTSTVEAPGPADPGTSLIDASPFAIPADGVSTAAVTVTLFDANGIPLNSGGVTDNGDGTYSATLTSSMTPGTATITGMLNGEDMVSTATVEFTPL